MRYETVIADVVRETDGAVLLRNGDTGQEEWVPKSLLEDPDGVGEGDEGAEVSVAVWKLKELGWEWL